MGKGEAEREREGRAICACADRRLISFGKQRPALSETALRVRTLDFESSRAARGRAAATRNAPLIARRFGSEPCGKLSEASPKIEREFGAQRGDSG